MCFLSAIALPTPMLTTIFSSFGNERRFSRPNFCFRCARTSSSYIFCRRGVGGGPVSFFAGFSFVLAMGRCYFFFVGFAGLAALAVAWAAFAGGIWVAVALLLFHNGYLFTFSWKQG